MKAAPYKTYLPTEVSWLEALPQGWEQVRGRFLIAVNPPARRALALDGTDEVSFVPMEAVGEYGGLNLERTKPLDEIGAGYTAFEDGDVIVAKITPCFENGKGALVQGLTNGVGFGTTELHVLRAGSRLDKRFLFYLTISQVFRALGESEMYGAGGQKRVPPDFAKDFRVPLPPLEEQQTIARFLDDKTEKIDELMTQKRQLIDKLKEKRKALIARAVTHGLPSKAAKTAGLDPNPEMKDAGVEWLDRLPKNWQILPMTKYLSELSDYRGKTPEKTNEGVFLVTARNVRMGFLDYQCSQEFVASDEYDEIMRRGLPKVGDILFTTEAPLGNVALVDREDIALAQRIIRFRMRKDYFHSRFALYAMLADYFQTQLKSLSTGSTAEGLKASKLSVLRLIAPPILEQHVIAAFLDAECNQIDGLLDKTTSATDKLQEYRLALITAAVTGQIAVREHA